MNVNEIEKKISELIESEESTLEERLDEIEDKLNYIIMLLENK